MIFIVVFFPFLGRRSTGFSRNKAEVLYQEKLHISTLKKKDLDNLCKQNVIPLRYHQEFLELRSRASVRDVLPETDAEDVTDVEND